MENNSLLNDGFLRDLDEATIIVSPLPSELQEIRAQLCGRARARTSFNQSDFTSSPSATFFAGGCS